MRRLSDTMCSQGGHKKADLKARRDCESLLPYLVFFFLDSHIGSRHRSILRAGVVRAVLKQSHPLRRARCLKWICLFLTPL